MQDFWKKVNLNGVYQCVDSTKIEFHASAFFVYKKVIYLKFYGDKTVKYLFRTEGQRPDDNIKLLEQLFEDGNQEFLDIKAPKLCIWNSQVLEFQSRIQIILFYLQI